MGGGGEGDAKKGRVSSLARDTAVVVRVIKMRAREDTRSRYETPVKRDTFDVRFDSASAPVNLLFIISSIYDLFVPRYLNLSFASESTRAKRDTFVWKFVSSSYRV